MPKIVKINSPDTNTNGTCFQGDLYATYSKLESLFGPPSDLFDSYKSDAEWTIEFESGDVATIYNWKNGKNYCGEDGYAVIDIEEWHIGGNTKSVESWINDFVHNSWPVFDDIRQQAQV